MEYNETAAKRHKKRKPDTFWRLFRLFAAILLSHCVSFVAVFSASLCSITWLADITQSHPRGPTNHAHRSNSNLLFDPFPE